MTRITKNNCKLLTFSAATLLVGAGLITANTAYAQEAKSVTNPDKFMIRLGSYFVSRADTDITVLDSMGVGASISFSKDLGGETTDSVPRIDGYYRFNDRHRLEFGSFTVDRDGLTTVDLTIGDEDLMGTITSNIKYTTTKVGYAYSFYHSPQVELSLAAGLNITDYNISYSGDGPGSGSGSNGVTAPLPVFGLQMTYAISPKWSVRYLSESFFIELEDKIEGSLLINELNIEYKMTKSFAIGAGISRVSTNFTIDDDDWKGGFSDSHRGALLYGSLYF